MLTENVAPPASCFINSDRSLPIQTLFVVTPGRTRLVSCKEWLDAHSKLDEYVSVLWNVQVCQGVRDEGTEEVDADYLKEPQRLSLLLISPFPQHELSDNAEHITENYDTERAKQGMGDYLHAAENLGMITSTSSDLKKHPNRVENTNAALMTLEEIPRPSSVTIPKEFKSCVPSSKACL